MGRIMKKLVFVSLLLALAGCQSTGGVSPAVEAAGRRYTIPYDGVEGSGAAQGFCAERGFASAVVVRHSGQRVTFYCVTADERARGLRATRGKTVCMDSPNGAKVCGRFE
jgi:hypothetical protein